MLPARTPPNANWREGLLNKSRDINIGMIGAGFMTKLHSIAYRNHPMYFFLSAANPVLHTVCDLVSDLA
jgi:hypothetical protein